MEEKQPTTADVTEAKGILADAGSSPTDRAHATEVMRLAKELGVREILVPKKNKGGPIKKKPKMMHGGMQKKAEMMGGGMYKGKKHSYAGGGMVKDMKLMRTK